ncbi:MAG: GGDEF domain-containing protein [Telluria sp.]
MGVAVLETTGGGVTRNPSPRRRSWKLQNEFERVSRALSTLGAGNRTLLRATDELQLLRDMCRVIVDTGGYRMALVAYAQHDDAKSIRVMVGAGVDIRTFDSVNFTWSDSKEGQTVTGTAIRTGEPVVGRHVQTDQMYAGPGYARLRRQAIAEGYVCISALPLRVDGDVLGALVIAAGEEDAFDAREVELLSELANDLTYGIATLRHGIEHKEARAAAVRHAFYDALTGLPNRTLLLEVLEEAIESSKRHGASLALLYLQVGRFHEINKVLGYRSSDSLLQQVGRRLEKAIGGCESLARVGEAQFAVLLPQGCATYATDVAKRLLSALNEPVTVGALSVDARVDIGIALLPLHATDAEELIRRADAAMSQVKRAMGGYAFYTQGQERECTRRLALMGDFHSAIGRGELQLYCQPKIDMKSRRVCGAEALVRWLHPVHGMMATTEFVLLAEQAGMIRPLTNWMLEAVVSQCHAWHAAGTPQAVALNLSVLDLYDPGFVDRVKGLVAESAIPPELLQFELTESAVMADPDSARNTLVALKNMGVKLFIDDYGTGYSSLSYLQKLPVDAIKIDQSFVIPMVASRDSAVIVSSTIELGHNLGLEVVAEGVETQAVWERLLALGCDVAQGYLMSRPIPASQLQAWEQNWS